MNLPMPFAVWKTIHYTPLNMNINTIIKIFFKTGFEQNLCIVFNSFMGFTARCRCTERQQPQPKTVGTKEFRSCLIANCYNNVCHVNIHTNSPLQMTQLMTISLPVVFLAAMFAPIFPRCFCACECVSLLSIVVSEYHQ